MEGRENVLLAARAGQTDSRGVSPDQAKCVTCGTPMVRDSRYCIWCGAAAKPAPRADAVATISGGLLLGVAGGMFIPVDGSGEKKLTSDLHLQRPSDLSVRSVPSE